MAAAKTLTEKATALERVLDKEASRLGRNDLLPRLREARVNIAKTHDVERALNLGDASVDARILGRALDKGKPLTGGLATAGRFAEAFPQVAGAAATSPAAGVSKLEHVAAAGLGLGGTATLGPVAGAAMAALPYVAPPAARSALLSDIYQRNFTRPSYTPALQPENQIQSLARIHALTQRGLQ